MTVFYSQSWQIGMSLSCQPMDAGKADKGRGHLGANELEAAPVSEVSGWIMFLRVCHDP